MKLCVAMSQYETNHHRITTVVDIKEAIMNHASQRRLRPAVLIIIALTLIWALASVPFALMTGNTEFVIYLGVTFVLMAVVGAVHRVVNLSTVVLACLSFWGLLHMIGGLAPVPESWPIAGDIRVFYSLWLWPIDVTGDGQPDWLKYDQVVHAFGFGITTWVCWQALCAAVRRMTGDGQAPRPTLGLMMLVVAAGMGFGAGNEIVEFLTTLVAATNVGGYVNTGWDLVFNGLGAATAGTAIFLGQGRRP